MRAGVAAPDPAGEHGDREQAERGNDQQCREQDEILRPEGRAKDVEFAFGKVPEHRLATAPVQPNGAEEQQEQNTRAADAQGSEQTGEAAGVDQVVAGLGLHLWTRRLESLY
ncbi:hypothetical protein D3C76_1501300 [compost metagenome]